MPKLPLSEIENTLSEFVDEIRNFAKLHDPDEFESAFMKECIEAPTYEKAYHIVEKRHHWLFGKNKYASYNSFRVSRSQRNKVRRS
ncbi:MAG: hypothetical protein WEA58_04640 [Balneolaceae bacterium]